MSTLPWYQRADAWSYLFKENLTWKENRQYIFGLPVAAGPCPARNVVFEFRKSHNSTLGVSKQLIYSLYPAIRWFTDMREGNRPNVSHEKKTSCAEHIFQGLAFEPFGTNSGRLRRYGNTAAGEIHAGIACAFDARTLVAYDVGESVKKFGCNTEKDGIQKPARLALRSDVTMWDPIGLCFNNENNGSFFAGRCNERYDQLPKIITSPK
ncbi:hypothetical protein GGU11DRAFT_753375 [Lentinula aff. detonsa]|nr:hypothetical protein GGU11DRAFT_753375 [Lentinula aff. detonsa]